MKSSLGRSVRRRLDIPLWYYHFISFHFAACAESSFDILRRPTIANHTIFTVMLALSLSLEFQSLKDFHSDTHTEGKEKKAKWKQSIEQKRFIEWGSMMKCQQTGVDGDDSTCTGIPFDVDDDTMCMHWHSIAIKERNQGKKKRKKRRTRVIFKSPKMLDIWHI